MSVRPELLAVLKRCIRSEEWETSRYDEFDYVHVFGRAQQALLLAAIFDPKLVEFDGSVVLAQAMRDENARRRFQDAKRNSSKSLQELEASFNRTEVPYLFLSGGQDIPDDDWQVLAEFIARSWRAHLAVTYPSRRFEVRVEPPEGDEEVTLLSMNFAKRQEILASKIHVRVTLTPMLHDH